MRPTNTERKRPREIPSESPSNRISVPLAWRRRVQRTSSLLESFYHATRGISVALQGERNLKIHFVMAIAAVGLGCYVHLEAMGWALLFLAIGLVITAEMLNTAVERVVDMFCGGQYNSLAKDAKDVAAGAVFCASIASLLIGGAVFLPALLAMLK
ncbi:MAG: diacylglycerol kinase family protein [Candidatus Obscuribacterales bacterium]|nr:diacylglycerol kinase family protein [Candidatus Obscuribacterales bacterium]